MNTTTTGARLLDPVTAATHLAELAAADASQIELDRNLTDTVADALVASGLAGLIAPVELGGHAAEPAVLVDAIATVSAGDASTGWCTAIGMGVNHLAGYLPRDGAADCSATSPARAALCSPQRVERRVCTAATN